MIFSDNFLYIVISKRSVEDEVQAMHKGTNKSRRLKIVFLSLKDDQTPFLTNLSSVMQNFKKI
jgi:hypothetical protein